MRLKAKFNVHGGIYTTIVVEHCLPSWKPSVVIHLP